MVYFQLVFAAITIVITAGSFLCRMNFTAWMIFVPLWITFSYAIGAYSLWGGGFLWQMGVIDYSGGYVIHHLFWDSRVRRRILDRASFGS